MLKKVSTMILLLCIISFNGNAGDSVDSTPIICDGVKVRITATPVSEYQVTHPVLFIGKKAIKLNEDPSYGAPECVMYKGQKAILYSEYAGNSYELYHLVDMKTYKIKNLSYKEAKQAGLLK